MDIISHLGLGALTPFAVIAIGVILIWRGDWVPRKIHEEVKKDRDDWRAAHEVERERMDKATTQLTALVSGQETVLRLIRSIQGARDDE